VYLLDPKERRKKNNQQELWLIDLKKKTYLRILDCNPTREVSGGLIAVGQWFFEIQTDNFIILARPIE
jgi:hypothetical protein